MLVRSIWEAAQTYPGNTFSYVSKQSLTELGLPEIFSFHGWPDFISNGVPVLPEYKAMLRKFFGDRSTQAWKSKFLVASLDQPYLLSQQFPCSAGGRLLDAGYLDKLRDADVWESFRLCLGVGSSVKKRPCILCNGPIVGNAHFLAECPAVLQQRQFFLASVEPLFADRLAAAPPGDWPSVLLSPHIELNRLALVVSFCAQIMDALGSGKILTMLIVFLLSFVYWSRSNGWS